MPGTLRDTQTGATYMLPSALGEFRTMGPPTRDEFDTLAARVDTFAEMIVRQKGDAVSTMVAQIEGEADGTRH